MTTLNRVKLIHRPDSTILCLNGCDRFAKMGSSYCSIECRNQYHHKKKAKERQEGYVVLEEKHVAPDTRSWEERWNSIYSTYGVNRDIRPDRHLEI